MLPTGTNLNAGTITDRIFAWQKIRAIDTLFAVPDARRIDHFMNVELRSAERLARDLVHLNIEDHSLNKTLSDWRKRIDSMTRMFETLSEQERPSLPSLKIASGPLEHQRIGVRHD